MPFYNLNDNITSNYLNQVYKTRDCIFFYYWNSCGHCHQFKPIFYNVIQDLKENNQDFMNNALIFQIELDNFDLIPHEFRDIQAFPSVIAYSNGIKSNEFKEQRTQSNLSKFILSSVGKPSKTLTSSKKKKVKKYI
jgi:thioredoxin-like negative regulator of GroEL